MKRTRRVLRRLVTRRSAADRGANRDGSVIIVVLALLIGLMILGILLLTDSSQEEISAEYFANAAKLTEPSLDPVPIRDDILRHIIVGADDYEPHSPFYGGRNSLLPTMFGNDLALYSGIGIRVVGDPTTGTYVIDNDFDGTADPNTSWWTQINHSPAATGEDRTRIGVFPRELRMLPAPDVPYTIADNTSPFLFYDAWVPAPGGGMRRVMLPSYFRPQLLRNTGVAPSQWFSDAKTAPYVMAAHMEHRAINRANQVALRGGVPIRRFVSARYPEPDPDGTGPLTAMTPFPFPVIKSGVWSGDRDANNNDWYDYGVDLDGDGINESFYMDFDFEARWTADGTRLYVPMAAVKMIPLDSLLNLNYHGNVSRAMVSNLLANINKQQIRVDGQVRQLPNYKQRVHGSHQGVNVSEINPLWAFLADPNQQPYQMNAPDFSAHSGYWGAAPTTRAELANMEYWWLKTGYMDVNTGRLIPGVYGESYLLRDRLTQPTPADSAQVFPMAGRTLPSVYTNPKPPPDYFVYPYHDDNSNRPAGGSYSRLLWQTTQPQPDSFSLIYPPFGQPLDYYGRGQDYTGVTQRLKRSVGRHVFPAYANYLANTPQWPSAMFLNSQQSQLYNEGAEIGWADALFGAWETLALQLFDAQLAATGLRGASVLQLMPYNFLNSPRDPDLTKPQNPIASETIRRLFTTESWDLNTFGKTFYGTTNDPRFRTWESSGQFPPTSGVTAMGPVPWAGTPVDPFRPEVRALLRMLGNNSTNSPSGSRPIMKRLSVNRILDGSTWRPLTPHPLNLPPDPVSGPNSVITGQRPTSQSLIVRAWDPTAKKTVLYPPAMRLLRQEWLARYDRQRLCRDIYVLLYMFGGGRDVDYRADNSTGAVYSAAQLREMAQFAVNLVDELDPDNVITRFEYDPNLADGWNLDDDPYNGVNPVTGANEIRGVVHGVEAQQLAFSEALPIFAKRTEMLGVGTDHAATDYDDSKHHAFTYFELQNVSPYTVSFNKSAWQVVITDPRQGTATPPLPTDAQVVERRLTFLPLAGGVTTPSGVSDARSRYSVGTQDDTGYVDMSGNIKPSFFLVNPQHGEAAPNNLTAPIRIAPATTNNFLDLMQGGSQTSYRINLPQAAGRAGDGPRLATTAVSPAGAQLLKILNPDGITSTGQLGVKLQLRRRLNPNRAEPTPIDVTGSNVVTHSQESADNPWIVVDEMVVPLRVFYLADPMVKSTALRQQLQEVRSRERVQPLDDASGDYPLTGTNPGNPDKALADNYILNSIGTLNAATKTLPPDSTGVQRFTLWQPHYDRDFASAAELMRIPLYGPSQVTQKLAQRPPTPKKIDLLNTAAARFMTPLLGPQGPLDMSGAPTNPGNRWYRVLGLLGVYGSGSSYGQSYAMGQERLPGRLNLNTISHPAILAALLDAPDFLQLNPLNRPPFLRDATDAARDWWLEFLKSRDGVDPVTGMPLPGVPGQSKPFRRLDYTAEGFNPTTGANAMERTILRSTPLDGDPIGGRRLFEIGTRQQHTNWQSSNNIDVSTRYRLYPKVMNNTTTRGNLFLLAVQIDYFEAREVMTDTGETVVRIGGKLPGNLSPGELTYYILDRSRMAGSLGSRDVAQQRTDIAGLNRFTWSFRQTLYFRNMIVYQRRIR